jgi:hypothetical protein
MHRIHRLLLKVHFAWAFVVEVDLENLVELVEGDY